MTSIFEIFWAIIIRTVRKCTLKTLAGFRLEIMISTLYNSLIADETWHAWHAVQESLHVQLCPQVDEHHHPPRHGGIQGVHEGRVGDCDEEMQLPFGREWEGGQLHCPSSGQVVICWFLSVCLIGCWSVCFLAVTMQCLNRSLSKLLRQEQKCVDFILVFGDENKTLVFSISGFETKTSINMKTILTRIFKYFLAFSVLCKNKKKTEKINSLG